MTIERLSTEIEELVAKKNGKMSFSEISDFVMVDQRSIEAAVMELCAQGKGNLVSGSTYVTSTFTNGLIDEIQQLMKNLGRVTLQELSSKFDIPADFIRDTINKAKEEK